MLRLHLYLGNPAVQRGKKAQVPVLLLFSLLLLDLSVYAAVYLLSEFYDSWASETSLKPGYINRKHTDVNEKSSTSSPALVAEIKDRACTLYALEVLWET